MEEVALFTIEVAFGEAPFQLEPMGEHLVQIRAVNKMWQKERAINILLQDLPSEYDQVVWMDCDLIYIQKNWPQRISEALNDYAVIQPYAWAAAMPDCKFASPTNAHVVMWDCFGTGNYRRSFAHYLSDKDRHVIFHKGHVGYVWAARREFLDRHKLYDPIITGCGDLFMALAFSGHLGFLDATPELRGLRQDTTNHFFDWAFPVFEDTQGRIGYTSDLVLHLWHGDLNTRNYLHLSQCLQKYGFNPNEDLRIGQSGCWEWNRKNLGLRRAVDAIMG